MQFHNGKKVLRLISNSPFSGGVLCLVNVLHSSSTFSQCLFHIQRLFEQIFTHSFSREITFFVKLKCMGAKFSYIYTYSININLLVLKEYMARPWFSNQPNIFISIFYLYNLVYNMWRRDWKKEFTKPCKRVVQIIKTLCVTLVDSVFQSLNGTANVATNQSKGFYKRCLV